MAELLERVRDARMGARAARRPASIFRRQAVPSWGGLAAMLGTAAWLASQANQRVVPTTRLGGRLGDAAGQLGRGLVAGMVGTLAITLAGALEQKLKGVKPATDESASDSPVIRFIYILHEPWLFAGDALGQVLGVRPLDDAGKRRLGIASHWLYGTSWGAGLGLLHLAGVRGPLAMGAMLVGQLSAEFVAMPAAKFFPPPSEWGRAAITSSVIDHTAYALAAGAAFDFLRPETTRP